MAEIRVRLVLDQVDEQMEARLPDNVPIDALIPDILSNIAELRQADACDWRLYNKTRDFMYSAADTLAGRNTAEDERLGLIPRLDAGADTGEAGPGAPRGGGQVPDGR